VADVVPGPLDSSPRFLTVVGDTVFFSAWTPDHGEELWRSDGTEAGTAMVADILSGEFGAQPFQLTRHGPRVFFTANDGVHGAEVWSSDGTVAGTVMTADVYPGSDSFMPTGLTSFDHRLAFWHTDGVHGWELWLSDGTPGGTAMAVELVAGPAGSRFPSIESEAVVNNGLLYFPAQVDGLGKELVVTDGTPGGTRVLDLVPGPNSSDPWDPVAAGGELFFAAMDLVHGRELWALELPLFRDGFSSGDTSRWTVVEP
jgi:ELWxxDGT repeat protein